LIGGNAPIRGHDQLVIGVLVRCHGQSLSQLPSPDIITPLRATRDGRRAVDDVAESVHRSAVRHESGRVSRGVDDCQRRPRSAAPADRMRASLSPRRRWAGRRSGPRTPR
jgi:hypothetical protein